MLQASFIVFYFFFFFNDTATTEIYTLSLHDALPIFILAGKVGVAVGGALVADGGILEVAFGAEDEHAHLVVVADLPAAHETVLAAAADAAEGRIVVAARPGRLAEPPSQLQSRQYLLCPPLLGTKNNTSD